MKLVPRAPALRKLATAVLLGFGAAAIVLLLGSGGWLESLELRTYDWRMQQAADPASVSRDIVLVEINDTTIRDLAPVVGRWPWPRAVFSTLIDFLARGRPRVIAVDVAFLEPERTDFRTPDGDLWTGVESDGALVESVRKAQNVILLADAVYMGVAGAEQATRPAEWKSVPYRLGAAIEERPLIVPPFQELAEAAHALGHNFVALDPDGPARRMPPFVRTGDKFMPSLGIAAVLAFSGVRPEQVSLESNAVRIKDRLVPLVPVSVADAHDPGKTHEQLTMLINYRAPALVNGQRPYPSYEARHLFASEQRILTGEKPLVDPAVFTGKIVFVGLTASGLMDVFPTPFGSRGTMPGIQLHASVADSVLSNKFVRPAHPGWNIAATVAAALLAAALAVCLPYAAGAIGVVAAMALWTLLGVRAFSGGSWLQMTAPLGSMALALFGGTAYRYFIEDREKRKVSRLFGRYVSRDVYRLLVDNPSLAELGGRHRDMSVLFSDIRGFTSVTEHGDAEDLVRQLNEYFSRMVEVIFRHGGTVDKFVGDMVMALFGAPVDDGDHAEHAVAAAVDMVRELAAINRKWAAEGRAQLDIGVGVNSGEMIAGNIGAASIMSYTVIGDNVNLASRLESLNKEYRTRIIISDATRTRLTGNYDIRPLGDVIVKGKTRAVAIFEVRVPSPVFSEEATL